MALHKSVRINGKTYKEHRVIWEQAYGPIPPGYEIHHINGIGTDNSLENLMCLTRREHKQLHARLKREGKDVMDPNDPDVIASRARQRDWYRRNAESAKEWQREHRATHKEELRAQGKAYRANNHEVCCAKNREYYAEHKDELLDYHRAYYEAHKKEKCAYARLRLAVKSGKPQEVIDKLRTEYLALKTTKIIDSTTLVDNSDVAALTPVT